MNTTTVTGPNVAGNAAACADDTAPAGVLAGLGSLFSDIEEAADALRELVADADPTALNALLSDALALMCWRCDLGRKLAGNADIARATTNERLLNPATAARLGL